MAAGPSAGATGKRTYREVTVGARDGGFAVLLDGKPLRTPMGTAVVVLSSALAEAIADEWRGQGAKPDLARVPLTRIAGTALDRVPPRRAELIRALVVYAGTELLCHRADRPADLVARQQQ
ncbi:MAG: ATPase, partial [Rhodospirillales bacterium]|nr:ATPase [Rhodospirillales bacterium]